MAPALVRSAAMVTAPARRAEGAYSALMMLAARMTLPHFSVSSAMNLPKSAGVIDFGTLPTLENCAMIFGLLTLAVISLFRTLDDAAFGAASDVTPKFVSPSDPAAQWTGALQGPAFFAYSDNYLIDVKFGIIMDDQSRFRSARSWSARRRPRPAEST